MVQTSLQPSWTIPWEEELKCLGMRADKVGTANAHLNSAHAEAISVAFGTGSFSYRQLLSLVRTNACQGVAQPCSPGSGFDMVYKMCA